ncbi:MAG: cation:proton antiporter [Clostridiaceae bacterium]
MGQLILRLIVAVAIAFFIGKLASKIKLPAILGWLLAGMILGPHAVGLVNEAVLNAEWYKIAVDIFECVLGLLIGTELIWNKIKNSGKQLIITTLTQSLGAFFVVTLVFGLVFYFTGIPVYLAFIFGGIALATAPAPALSIVREFKTDGPVTRTLIPMAALDDMVAVVVFFSTMGVVAANVSEQKIPMYMILLVVLLPMIIGIVTGFLAGFLLKKDNTSKKTILLLVITILISAGVGLIFDNVILPKPVLNYMLIGMAFSATFANMISEDRLNEIMNAFNPILGISMIVVILDLGTPLDYHLIFGAGLFTAIYIIARAIGKYGGAFFGATITNSPKTVKKYLGLTLLPHSGVSLVFTGIAVSVLTGPDPESAKIIQGTIAAAAVINEVIAVIVAKKAFEWSGEFNKKDDNTLGESNSTTIA